MDPYIPALVWLAGIALCACIGKRRHVKPTLFWKLFVVSLGPLAIPFVFLARPVRDDNQQ